MIAIATRLLSSYLGILVGGFVFPDVSDSGQELFRDLDDRHVFFHSFRGIRERFQHRGVFTGGDPGRFDDDVTRPGVSPFGHAAGALLFVGTVFRGKRADKRIQLAQIGKTLDVYDLAVQGDGREKTDAGNASQEANDFRGFGVLSKSPPQVSRGRQNAGPLRFERLQLKTKTISA